MNNEIEELKNAVAMIADDLAWTLTHLAEPEKVGLSDLTHMAQVAERLERLSEALKP